MRGSNLAATMNWRPSNSFYTRSFLFDMGKKVLLTLCLCFLTADRKAVHEQADWDMCKIDLKLEVKNCSIENGAEWQNITEWNVQNWYKKCQVENSLIENGVKWQIDLKVRNRKLICNVSENGLIGYGAWGGGRGGQRWWFWPQFRVISGQQRGKGGAHFNWPGNFFGTFLAANSWPFLD